MHEGLESKEDRQRAADASCRAPLHVAQADTRQARSSSLARQRLDA
jgi:hypothetical protein